MSIVKACNVAIGPGLETAETTNNKLFFKHVCSYNFFAIMRRTRSDSDIMSAISWNVRCTAACSLVCALGLFLSPFFVPMTFAVETSLFALSSGSLLLFCCSACYVYMKFEGMQRYHRTVLVKPSDVAGLSVEHPNSIAGAQQIVNLDNLSSEHANNTAGARST